MPSIGIITGTRQEAACVASLARRGAVAVAATLCRPDAAAAVAERMIRDGCGALVSFGTAGGLDPALAPGSLIVGDAVFTPDGATIAAGAPWSKAMTAALAEAGIRHARGALVGCDAPVASVAAKSELYQRTRALGIDMESYGVAVAARAAGVPWIALRAVADPAGSALPRAIAEALGAAGGFGVGRVLGALLRRPGGIGEVVAFAGAGRRALGTLRRVAAAGVLLDAL